MLRSFFFFKQKTAYEVRISDWSSDVCSSDLAFGGRPDAEALSPADSIPEALARPSAYLTHPVFNTHHSETEMLRYMRRLSDRDLALDRAMLPLGSCTMKLNATVEMLPVTWPEFGQLHPFAPAAPAQGSADERRVGKECARPDRSPWAA